MNSLQEHNILIFLVQLVLLLGFARGLGELFRRWKQPTVTAEILVGIVFGPTIFGRVFPGLHGAIFPRVAIQESMLETVAWLGVFFLLLDAGLQIDFSNAWRQKSDALKIALSDIILPMAIAFIPFYLVASSVLASADQRLVFALFMATVSTISALPLTARALHDLDILKTDLGFLIMSALSVNDIIGWVVFTTVLGIAVHAQVAIWSILLVLGGTIGFTVFCLTIGRSFSEKVISGMARKHMPEPASSLTFICLFGMICGAITQRIGIHALFGFFIAGIAAGGAKALSEKTRNVISQMVYGIFVPVFFASIGLRIDFLANFNVAIVAMVTIIGIAGRFLGAWFGVAISNQPRENRLAISISHTPGGEMAIIIGIIALEVGLIPAPVFIAIIFGAVASSIAVGPWLNYAMSRREEVSLLRFFQRSSIIPELKSSTRDGALKELCKMASRHPQTPETDIIYSYVLEREEQMGTGIGDGLAVPHARFPVMEKPAVAFGRSAPGIEWNAPDGKPVSFVFLILTQKDDKDIQVQLLAAIADSFKNEDMRRELSEAEGSEKIWHILRKAFLRGKIKKKT